MDDNLLIIGLSRCDVDLLLEGLQVLRLRHEAYHALGVALDQAWCEEDEIRGHLMEAILQAARETWGDSYSWRGEHDGGPQYELTALLARLGQTAGDPRSTHVRELKEGA